MKIKVISVKPILTEEQIKDKEGHKFPESHYKQIIKSDADVYGINENGKKQLLLKFRKNVIPNDVCVKAYMALEKHAKHKNHNRGAAAGVINSTKSLPSHVGKITKKDKFRIFYKTKSGNVSRDNIGNMSQSNIAGYYDRPDRNLYNTKYKNTNKTKKMSKGVVKDKKGAPLCRTTKFTAQEVEKWKATIPLVKCADKLFAELVPDRHTIQLKRARLTPKYQIDNTAYSTITINYDWRTSAHRDSGDLEEGFGNLLVLEKEKCIDSAKNEDFMKKNNKPIGYTGAYLGFPRWGIAVDVRQGDYLAMDVHQFHANTELHGSGRLSVVCYLRKKMINCKIN
jgi:hypothetical protein